MAGLLPGGLQGTLAHYTYYVQRSDGQQGSHSVPYPNAVVIAQIPDIDWLCQAAAYVAGRIRGEALEGASPSAAS